MEYRIKWKQSNDPETYKNATGVDIHTAHKTYSEERASGYDGEYEVFCNLLRLKTEKYANEKCGNNKSISLKRVRELTNAVAYDELQARVDREITVLKQRESQAQNAFVR